MEPSSEATAGTSRDASGRDSATQESSTSRSCDFQVVRHLDAEALLWHSVAAGGPVLVTDAALDSPLYADWRRDAFVRSHGEVVLEPQAFPYSSVSAQLYDWPRRKTTVRDWVGYVAASSVGNATGTCNGSSSRAEGRAKEIGGGHGEPLEAEEEREESLIDEVGTTAAASPRSSATADATGASGFESGVFSRLSGTWQLAADTDGPYVRSDIELTEDPSALPPPAIQRLLANFSRPSFLESEQLRQQWPLRTASVQFYLGPKGSGAQPHWHGLSWNWLVHGHKQWYVWPPSSSMYTQRHAAADVGADFAPGQPLRCEQKPGDIVIMPNSWGHATLNLSPSIGWASELHVDRLYDDGFDPFYGAEWWRTRDADT